MLSLKNEIRLINNEGVVAYCYLVYLTAEVFNC